MSSPVLLVDDLNSASALEDIRGRAQQLFSSCFGISAVSVSLSYNHFSHEFGYGDYIPINLAIGTLEIDSIAIEIPFEAAFPSVVYGTTVILSTF